MPFLTDSRENIISIVRKAKECGAKYILFMAGVTLRDSNREYYFERLEELFPGLKGKYLREYGGRYVCDAVNSGELYRVFREECERLGIDMKMKFYREREVQMRL